VLLARPVRTQIWREPICPFWHRLGSLPPDYIPGQFIGTADELRMLLLSFMNHEGGGTTAVLRELDSPAKMSNALRRLQTALLHHGVTVVFDIKSNGRKLMEVRSAATQPTLPVDIPTLQVDTPTLD
jgi:hypothetical protein